MLYNPKTKQIIIRRSYQTLHDNDQPIPDPIHQSTHILPTTLTTTDPINLSPPIISHPTSKTKNCAALPGQPYHFTKIQPDPENDPPRRSSRIRAAQTISPTIINSYVKDNKGRRRSLRHAHISNRFTCLSSDDDDDSIIPNNSSNVFSTTDQDTSDSYNSTVANDDNQIPQDLPDLSPALLSPVIISDNQSSLILLPIDKLDTNLTKSSDIGPVNPHHDNAVPSSQLYACTTHTSQYIDFTISTYVLPTFFWFFLIHLDTKVYFSYSKVTYPRKVDFGFTK
jgi:hypothetical protein